MASGIVLGICVLMIVLAQWSTNTSGNVIPAATIFSNIGGPKVPFWAAVIIAGIVGILAQPWSLFGVLVDALLIIGGILTAIVGILFADYYLIRKRRVNVRYLYELDGQYKYMNVFNLAGLFAWVLGGALANMLPSYSAFVGFVCGAVVYFLLPEVWWFRTDPDR